MKVIEAYELKDNVLQKIKVDNFKKNNQEWGLLEVFDKKITNILGFGGAITETSSYNYSLMNIDQKRKALEALFSSNGLNYSFFRLCVGSSDFYLNEYCYVKDNDYELKTFSIEKDKKYIIPFIKDILKFTNSNVTFIASPWSPPSWMKTNNTRFSGGKLKKEFYETYARYLCLYLIEYKKLGINIEYFTIQNEQKATQEWESCVFTLEEEIKFAKVFIKELKKSHLKVKLLAWDHNKERLIERSESLNTNLFSGIAYHWYSGEYYDSVSLVRKLYPNKVILETEFCVSSGVDETHQSYVDEYINSIRCGSNGLIEWNLITDKNGGPYHNRKGGCLSPITYIDNRLELSKNYLQSYLFSHFINKGAISLYTASYSEDVKISAVKNSDGTYVININNKSDDFDAKLYFKGRYLSIHIAKNAAYVIVIK